jgi:hypothetical protein
MKYEHIADISNSQYSFKYTIDIKHLSDTALFME